MLTRRHVVGLGLTGLAAAPLLLRPDPLRAQAAPAVYDIPLQLTPSRLAMQVRINGSGPFGLVLDTGGALSLIDADVARQLRLQPRGRVTLGLGGKTDRYDLYRADEVQFGDRLRQPGVAFAATKTRFGEGMIGSLASGFLASFDSELDFAALRLRIYPNGSPARPGWDRQVRTLRSSQLPGASPHFFADAALGDVAFSALLDTGAPPALIAHPELVRRLALPDGPWSPEYKRGNTVDRIIRYPAPFRLGSLVVDRPLVSVRGESRFGADAIVGLPLLRQLDLATDVKDNLLFIRPNGQPAPPPRYNMSGLWVDRDGDRLTAGAVGRGSPAEGAGIHVGDRLSGMDFQTMIRRLNGSPGDHVALTVASGAGTGRAVDLTLRDYL